MSATDQLSNKPKLAQQLKSRPSSVVFSLKLIVYVVLLAHGVSLALSTNSLLKILGIVLTGVMFAHGVELQHQALHYQGFKSKKWNAFFGILLGLPMLVSFHEYQDSHLRHHKLLGTSENKEFFDYGDQYGGRSTASVFLWIIRLGMIKHYWKFFVTIVNIVFSKSNEKNSKAIRMDYMCMVLAIALLSALSLVCHSTLIIWSWLAPLMLVAAPVHALIEMPEHYRCDLTSTDPYRNTRSITSNAFMTWLTNGNNFHVEHHMMPALSMDRLHDLHSSIEPKIHYYHRTYRDFYSALLRGKLVPRELDAGAIQNVLMKDDESPSPPDVPRYNQST
ncbi:fatty acid desaturase family protein [Robbsia andropogonis]|uniref:fatty acid desaturase family protein n=1 Tax=Robbsia andropogonis TaxID=28092 RepID=UPI000464A66C|nr:fatty acid desaturase [Robbsia andropogonis]MCP1118520.1 fatty acid desaturase [Robbsia andropogonis]MCP1127987.1 fatty acid desaturase [Robbsia andropogonis]